MVVLGAVCVLVLSALVPLFTDSRMILNLHLLRSFVMIAMLSLISVAVVAARWLLEPSEKALKLLGLGLAAALASGKVGLLLCLLLLLVELWRTLPAIEPVLRSRVARVSASYLLALCLVTAVLGSGVKMWRLQQEMAIQQTWEKIGRWAHTTTSPDAVFQVSPNGALGFSLTSERQLWFDGKFGAAVMWSPSYYVIWKERYLSTVERSFITSRVPGIEFLAMPCDETVMQAAVHREDGICVYRLN